MMFDVWNALRSGGRVAIDLLEYSVASAHLEILFAHLAAEYRYQPTAGRAIALYDAFCAPRAPGRIHAPAVLPPANLSLAAAVERIREQGREVDAFNAGGPDVPIVPPFPGRHLFDAVHAAVCATDNLVVRVIRETYDPARSPVANLPGGRRSASQRYFVERVWRPELRPFLVRSGFPRLASIGG